MELQKHVQFEHPETLDQAISLAGEYVAFQGAPLERFGKLEDTERGFSVRKIDEKNEQQKGGMDKSTLTASDVFDLRATINRLEKTVQKLMMERGQATPDPNGTRFPRGTCFLCGDPSHFAKSCPRKRNWNGRVSQGEGESQGSSGNKQLN